MKKRSEKRIDEAKMQSPDKIVGRVIKCRAHFATSSSSRSALTQWPCARAKQQQQQQRGVAYGSALVDRIA